MAKRKTAVKTAQTPEQRADGIPVKKSFILKGQLFKKGELIDAKGFPRADFVKLKELGVL